MTARALWRLIRGEEAQRVRNLRGVLELLRPYRRRVVLMFAALLLATAAALAPPYLAGRAIDDGIRKGDIGALDVIVVLFLASALANWGATYAQTYLVNWVGERALQDLRLRIFRHLQRQSLGFYARRRYGRSSSRTPRRLRTRCASSPRISRQSARAVTAPPPLARPACA